MSARCGGVILAALTILLVACADDPLEADARGTRASLADSEVQVGLVWDAGVSTGFIHGAEMARDRLNETGGILGRPLQLIPVDEGGDDSAAERGREISRHLGSNPDLVAVVGHAHGDVAMAASVNYERFGILFLAPAVTRMDLTQSGFQYVFRTIPNNELRALQLAAAASKAGFRRIALLHSRTTRYEEQANAFETYAVDLGMRVVFRRSYFDGRDNYRGDLANLSGLDVDAVLVASGFDTTRAVIVQSREMGVDEPILVGELLTLAALQEALGPRADGIVVPLVFNPESRERRILDFRASYQSRHASTPAWDAAQGFDAIMLLAHVMEQAGSTTPLTAASLLRYTLAWQGITGRPSFTRAGDVYTKVFSFASMQNGEPRIFSFTDE